MGALAFLYPWLLGALVLVPALWWLLRAVPPRPRTVSFPAYFLVAQLRTDIRAASRTPWWLLVLRALIVTLFIFALAEPVLRRGDDLPGRGGPVLVVVDNGWSAAAEWPRRLKRVEEFLARAGRDGRAVVFLPTAPAAVDGQVQLHGPMPTGEGAKILSQLSPQPWPADHDGADRKAAELLARQNISHAVFFSDGTMPERAALHRLITRLQGSAGGVTFVHDTEVNRPHILRRDGDRPSTLALTAERLPDSGRAEPLVLHAYGAAGNILDEKKHPFPAGESRISLEWDVLAEMRSAVARVALASPASAAGVVLTDAQWQQHPVGIVGDPAKNADGSVLNEIYYLRRALEGGGTVAVDMPDELLKQPLSAIVWPDSTALSASDRVRLLEWVEAGGFLIRFAGPNLAASPDDALLPVPLRYGQRAMQGAMTWEKPVRLGGMDDASPLFGLAVPEDVAVSRQVLAQPTPDVFEKTWLQLEDGTPLVTGGSVGGGTVVLVHTTAGPGWSNFCYSGLYVESLRRMISLSNGIRDYRGQALLPPLMVLDGFGRLQTPDLRSVITAIDPAKGFIPGPATPPGLYGVERQFQVFNLGDALATMTPVDGLPRGVINETYALTGEQSLKPDFFRWALWLLLVDTLVTFWLRGVISLPRVRRNVAAAVVFALLFSFAPAQAAPPDEDPVGGMYFAYVETGDADTDRISHNGLTGLMKVVNARSNIRIRGVHGVDPSEDALAFYPFLYWPMTEAQQALPLSAARNLQNYMAHGGMILIDTRDQQFAAADGNLDFSTPGTRQLRKLTEDIRIAELMPVVQGHILTKSFYILDSFPGRYTGGTLWVEKEPGQNHDGVTTVIVGGNDWASVWSDNPADQARVSALAGGPRQREMAYRFGVNLAMVALAGNYKADQLHIPYILERFGR